MGLPQGQFVNVSGIDPHDGAKIVFVWCPNKGLENYALLGSGHVVGALASVLPPGIAAGQFSVTFLLPPGCDAEDVFVTDDVSGKQHLPDVTVTPCSGSSEIRSPAIAEPADVSGSVGATNAIH